MQRLQTSPHICGGWVDTSRRAPLTPGTLHQHTIASRSHNGLWLDAMSENAASLSRLLLAERPSLVRLAQRIVGNAAAAEDVAQSLWMKVQRIADDPPILNKRAFLFRLASNLARDHVRSQSSRAALEAKAQAYLSAPLEMPSPEQSVIAGDELGRVLKAAEALPEPTKGMFRLHRFQGLTQAQVAAHYGVSTTTIEKHMRRAMAVLRKARDGA